MYEIGRLCVKLAGRDAGKRCVVIDKIDSNTVLIDGQTRRRKINIKHLEPLPKVLKISKNLSHTELIKLLKTEHIEVKEKAKKKA